MSVELEIVRIPAKPGSAEVLVDVLQSARTGYLAPPHCLGVELARDANGAEVVAIVSWASPADHEAAQKGPHAEAFFKAVMAHASAPPSIAAYRGERSSAGCALDGEVAIVTGGANGIGRAVVERYLREGAKVCAADISSRGLQTLKEEYPTGLITVEADLTTASGNMQAVDEAIAHFGKLDVFVANAGLFDGFSELADLSLEALDKGFETVFNVNVRGLILGARAALPHLVKTRGSLIVTLSNSSLYPDGGGVIYVASKHAALGVVRQLAHELAPAVRVNGVAPGATRTQIQTPAVFGLKPSDLDASAVDRIIEQLTPLALHARPEDHAGAYVLLASRLDARAMTGTVIESEAGLGVRGLRRTRGGDRFLPQGKP